MYAFGARRMNMSMPSKGWILFVDNKIIYFLHWSLPPFSLYIFLHWSLSPFSALSNVSLLFSCSIVLFFWFVFRLFSDHSFSSAVQLLWSPLSCAIASLATSPNVEYAEDARAVRHLQLALLVPGYPPRRWKRSRRANEASWTHGFWMCSDSLLGVLLRWATPWLSKCFRSPISNIRERVWQFVW